MKKLILVMLCVSLVGLWFAPNSMAASEAEKRAAIDKGLAYMAAHQNANGSWTYDGSGPGNTAATGAALLAFLEEKPNWAADYNGVVTNGLNYLFSQATPYNIANEPAGNPDTNTNGIGVKFVTGGNNTRDTYVTGLVIPAIVATGTPTAVVTVGSQAGRTYKDVVQDTMDYFAFSQADPINNYRGGWRYYADYNQADQSTTQWPVIAGLYGSAWGLSYPAFVKTELAAWTNYIQNPAGWAGYDGPNSPLGEMNETGSLLIQQAFLGKNTSDPKVQAALNYINNQWLSGANNTWDGNFGHPYAMWAVYKGLELLLGLDNMAAIGNLHANPGDVDNPNHGWNWWEDYCEYLVNSQKADGSWDGYSYWNWSLATPWYINILAATIIPDGPEPAAMLLLGSSLAGFGAIARRRRKK